MKKTFALVGLLSCMLISISAISQTADEIINKYIEAIGGKDAWKKVNSISSTGSLQVQGTDVAITTTTLHQKGRRQDISVMGMNGFIIITPTEGWMFMPFSGQTDTTKMTQEELDQNLPELDAQGAMLDYKDKGHTIELLGKDSVDGNQYYKLKATLKGGRVETIYIDPKTYYVARMIANSKVNGQDVDQTISFSNFQKLPEGIVVPMTIGLPNGDLNISKVEVNKEIDESIFKLSK